MKPHLLLGLLASLALARENRAATASPFLAYSLREAAVRLQAGQTGAELRGLGGLTRILGLVQDASGDLILVGRAIDGLPGADLDDLVVALRCRQLHDTWPKVSIEPDEGTSASGQQRVRFSDGLANTRYGQSFLASDIDLKLFSLQLATFDGPVPSYRAGYEHWLQEQAAREGIQLAPVRWQKLPHGRPAFPQFEGRPIRWEDTCQLRFWFTKAEPCVLRGADGAFCIDELRLQVQCEILGQSESATAGSHSPLARAGFQFAEEFTRQFSAMAEARPELRRLKILYDLIAVADGIQRFRVQPNLDYLLHEYPVTRVDTPAEYELIVLGATVSRSDGREQVVCLNGGIHFQTQIRWMNAGSLKPLRQIVEQCRPDPHALTWHLPLEGWSMPNGSDLEPSVQTATPKPGSTPGCLISSQSLLLDPETRGGFDIQRRFAGFPPPPPPPPHALSSFGREGGVSFRMEIDDRSFTSDPSGTLDRAAQRARQQRPNLQTLDWPFNPDQP